MINVSLNTVNIKVIVANKSSLYMQISLVLYLLNTTGFQVSAILL